MYFEHGSKEAAFHFAAEEYIMRDVKPDKPAYMLWQTGDTVMIGANQVVAVEIDKEYAHSAGIEIVRRSSGGGTIFTDSGTLLFTVILPYSNDIDAKEIQKEYFSVPVVKALEKLGVPAKLEGRNDILIDGKKISGIAQYVKYGYLCTHGSLLFNADIEKLSRVLTVDLEKITSKALRSVESRVTNIADYIKSKDISDLKNALAMQCHTERKDFSENDIAPIHEIMHEKYKTDKWTYGHTPPFSFCNSHRFSDGIIEVYLDTRNGYVEECRIYGDFLALRPVSDIEEALKGSLYEGSSLLAAISEIDFKEYFGSISKNELLNLMLGNDFGDGGLND